MSVELSHTHLRNLVKIINTKDCGVGTVEATVSTGQEQTVISSRLARRFNIRGGRGIVLLSLPGTGCDRVEQDVVVDDMIARQYGDDVVVGLDYLDFAEPWFTAKTISCRRDDPEWKRRFKIARDSSVVARRPVRR